MPNWKPARPSHPDLSRTLLAWLRLGGSLSAHLAHRFGTLRVARAQQGRGVLRPDERHHFPGLQGHCAHIRDVVLSCDGRPLVMAHSATARASIRGPWRGLLGLGSRPLAELLFHDRKVQRLPLQSCRVHTRSRLGRQWAQQWQERTGQPTWQSPRCSQLWVRRSVFLRHGHPLLVTEIFDAHLAKFAPSTHGKPQARRPFCKR